MSLIDTIHALHDTELAGMMRALSDETLAGVARLLPRIELLDIAVAAEKAREGGAAPGPTAPPVKATATDEQVLEILRAPGVGELSLAELREALHANGHGDPAPTLRALVRRGTVRVSGRGKGGRYALAQAEMAS